MSTHMRCLTLLCASFLIASCATPAVKRVPVAPQVLPERAPPAGGLVVCQKPAPLSDASFGEVVRALSDAISDLESCEAKRASWQDWYTRGRDK